MYNTSFKFEPIGSFSVYNPMNMVTVVAMMLVYLGLPGKIVGAIAENCLGNLSKVYRNGIRQEVSVESLFAGMTARAMLASVAFEELSGCKYEMAWMKKEGAEPTVTSTRLEQAILDLFQSGGRIDNMDEAKKVQSLLAYEMGDNTRRSFLNVALNNDIATLRSVADHFDEDRKHIPLCERLFREKPPQKDEAVIMDFEAVANPLR